MNKMLDRISDYLATRKGLLPIIGIALIVINLFLQLLPVGWLRTSNLFLHLGVIVAIVGFLLARIL